MSKLKQVHAFLLGEGEIDASWFDDNHAAESGAFWWRNNLREAIAEEADLLKALRGLCGMPDIPKNGWHGTGTSELYQCEYCGRKHKDFRLIEHGATCPIPQARAAIAKADGEGA